MSSQGLPWCEHLENERDLLSLPLFIRALIPLWGGPSTRPHLDLITFKYHHATRPGVPSVNQCIPLTRYQELCSCCENGRIKWSRSLFSYFPGDSVVKNPPASVADLGSIPGSGSSPGGGNGNLLHPVFLPGESNGQRSPAGYSPWGHKESRPLNTAQPCFPGVYNQREECREHISVHTESSSEDFSLVGESVLIGCLPAGWGLPVKAGARQCCSSCCRSAGHCPRSPEPTQEVSPGGALSRWPPGHPGDRGASRIS